MPKMTATTLRAAVLRGIACAGLLALLPAPTLAQTGSIEIELNNAADQPGGCRLTYVATNTTSVGLERTSYEVAVFDATGVVKRLVVLEFGWLPAGKTRVLQFDLPEQACGDISRISVNGPVECSAAAGEQTLCRDQLILSSRLREIQFN